MTTVARVDSGAAVERPMVGIVKFAVSVAASGDDGRNVIAALQAKRLGMTQVIAIVSDPD